MAQRHSLTAWAVIAVQLAIGYLANRNFLALPELSKVPPAPSMKTLGHVSIVVPARNEELRLPDLLRSLADVRGVDFDITVVDDGSTDGTRNVAQQAGAHVIRVAGPPPGWTGKAFACHTGALATSGDWLLFTDADTVHGPDSLHRSLNAACRNQVGLLSLVPRQHCGTFWERLLLPYAYALYFVGALRPNGVGGAPIANGQYLLFRRADYDRVGGHASVRGSIVDDVDLARVAAAHGVSVLLLRAERDVSVRMYSSLPELWAGFGKNAFRFVRASPRSGLLTVIAAVVFSASLPAALLGGSTVWRLAVLAAPAVSLSPWLQRFGVPRRYAVLHPVAASVFQLLALDSIRRTLVPGQTLWKGRHY